MRSRNLIPGLDGLRAFSIILVLMGHASQTIPVQSPFLETGRIFWGNSHIGVLMFFVISGYLITRILRDEWSETQTIDLRGFYLRRVLRIFPAFCCYLLVVTLLCLAGWIYVASDKIVAAATFTFNYSHWQEYPPLPTRSFWFVGHFWTLCLEEQFYLLWPLMIWKFGLHKSKHIAVWIIAICPFIRVLSYFLWPSTRGQLGMMLHSAADPLMMGCLVALWERNPQSEVWINRLSNGVLPTVAASVAFVISPLLSARFRGSYGLPFGMSIESFSVAIVLLYVTRYFDNFVGVVLNSRVMVSIGVLSYSLYLWQQLFLVSLNGTWSGKFPFNLLCCFLAAAVSYHLVEKPFLKLKRRLSR